jgi:tRNA pseudouridine55 synthase
MNGFVVIDKPKGITSHDVVSRLRRVFDQKKIGHCGTLDPIATGVLLVALGEATKLVEYFLNCDKVYEVTAELGKISDTFDSEGKMEDISSKVPSEKKIVEILNKNFIGEIEQVPPKFSALKIDGKRAYKLAREGKKFDMHARKIKIHRIEVLDYKYPFLKLKVHCGKGTYIRSLVHDLGQLLKVGAYMKELRRTQVARFDISQSSDIESCEDSVIPMKEAVSHLNRILLMDREYARLKDGAIIQNEHKVLSEPVFAVFHDEVVGVLEFPQKGRLLKFHKKLNIF